MPASMLHFHGAVADVAEVILVVLLPVRFFIFVVVLFHVRARISYHGDISV